MMETVLTTPRKSTQDVTEHKKILICVLNWGLGHSTRCIPIIQELQKQGAEVALASDGRALNLLKKEFPALQTFELPAYNVTYRTNNMVLNLLPQLTTILGAIRKERKLIQQLIQQENFDCVISDNRFGCVTEKVPSIFITHQVNILVPIKAFKGIVRYINKRYIKKFTECWIPDNANTPNLSGILAHEIKGLKVKYMGILSRMKNLEQSKKYDLAVVLSGPEPQRSILEEKITKQALQIGLKTIIVQGKPEQQTQEQLSENIERVSFLTGTELNQVFAQSDLIISRSGYTTVLDLAKTDRKAILIPTPGQTEQEYLAENLMEQGVFFSQTQDKFDLAQALEKSKAYKGFGNAFFDSDHLENIVRHLLSKLLKSA